MQFDTPSYTWPMPTETFHLLKVVLSRAQTREYIHVFFHSDCRYYKRQRRRRRADTPVWCRRHELICTRRACSTYGGVFAQSPTCTVLVLSKEENEYLWFFILGVSFLKSCRTRDRLTQKILLMQRLRLIHD